jgi:rsbT co-antagonist protein RsbR
LALGLGDAPAADEIAADELDRRKDFLDLADDDGALLTSITDLAREYADGVIEDFYRHLLAFDDTRAFFADPQVLQHVKTMQKEYFLRLTEGNYELAYAQTRVRIGAILERVGLPAKADPGLYNFYLQAVAARLGDAYRDEPERAWAAFLSLMTLTFLDIGLAIDSYMNAREFTSRQQAEAMPTPPAPARPSRQGMLTVPLIGLLDARGARQLTDQVLTSIRDNRARVVVLDITGVQSVDARVAKHMVQTIEAARLMGSRVIVAGISPEIAQTMVTLGIDLGRILTVGDLQSGVAQADQWLGFAEVG